MTAATATALLGSMMIFMRSHTHHMAEIISSSLTSKTLADQFVYDWKIDISQIGAQPICNGIRPFIGFNLDQIAKTGRHHPHCLVLQPTPASREKTNEQQVQYLQANHLRPTGAIMISSPGISSINSWVQLLLPKIT